jgi:hypothetical protein
MALIFTLLAIPLGVVPASAVEPALPGECPQLKPLSEVAVGATGNGWTVERGTQRERFRFEVLGIIPGGIAPGRDLIVVEISDTESNDMIARAGGIWAGMSGTPLYLGNKLLGAIAYGLTAGPSMVGGVTPAVDMADVLDYGAPGAALQTPARVSVPSTMRSALAARAGVSAGDASYLERLPIAFSVSGLDGRGRDELRSELDKRGISAIVVPAATAPRSAGTVISSRPAPGGNFAGVVSYGDVTLGGLGTTTYVCGNKALAFGHPLSFGGAVAFGANDANAVAVVADPARTPFKLGNITGLFGKLDQDRLTAIRVKLNATPSLRAITSHITNADTGFARNGRTDVTMSEWVPSVAPLQLLSNGDVVFDQIGGGSSVVSWTINGKRANGNSFHLEYTNRYASQSDLSFESAFQLGDQLAAIDGNPFEAIRFTSVHIDATFDDTFREYGIESVKISKNGGPFRDRSSISVGPGDNLRARVGLRSFRGNLVTVDVQVAVPNSAELGSFGSLLIRGGGEFFFGDEPSANSFPQLLSMLKNSPRNDDLVAELVLQSFDGPPSSSSVTHRMDAVVHGFVEIGLSVE